MAIDDPPGACMVTMFNPDLQAIQDGAFVTEQAAHGQVGTELLGGNQTVQVIYKALPGYAGPDRFEITFEPGARNVVFNVAVRPSGASSK